MWLWDFEGEKAGSKSSRITLIGQSTESFPAVRDVELTINLNEGIVSTNVGKEKVGQDKKGRDKYD